MPLHPLHSQNESVLQWYANCNKFDGWLWESNECKKKYKLHCCSLFVCFRVFVLFLFIYSLLLFVFHSTVWQLSCITERDIGAYDPQLLIPFAIWNYLMYFVPNDNYNDELKAWAYDLLYFLYLNYVAIKHGHCQCYRHLRLLSGVQLWSWPFSNCCGRLTMKILGEVSRGRQAPWVR